LFHFIVTSKTFVSTRFFCCFKIAMDDVQEKERLAFHRKKG